MKFTIKPHYIKKLPENEVTSNNVLAAKQLREAKKYEFDENGIFSMKIFGQFDKCECGERTTPGYCEKCNTRVIDRNHIPDFYINLPIQVPKLYMRYDKKNSKLNKQINNLLTYNAFWCDGYHDDIDDDYDERHLQLGVEAARNIDPNIDEWVDKYCKDYISIPHISYRQAIIGHDGKIILGPINQAIIEVLNNIINIKEYEFAFDGGNPFVIQQYYKQLIEIVHEFDHVMYELMTKGKKSFFGNNLKAKRFTGAVKGVIVNRYDIDEDIVLIGDSFISTLYPYYYNLYNGDMEAINNAFIENNDMCIMNRPPTIGHYSIIGVKPRVASCYKYGTFDDYAIGPNKQSEYDDEIDTIGLRVLGLNPIVCDGLAADYDGDALLCASLWSNKAKKDAEDMLPSKNWFNWANGTIRNAIPEGFELAKQDSKLKSLLDSER